MSIIIVNNKYPGVHRDNDSLMEVQPRWPNAETCGNLTSACDLESWLQSKTGLYDKQKKDWPESH